MIVFGNTKCLKYAEFALNNDKEQLSIFNLSSTLEVGERLFKLIPPFNVEQYNDEKEFDINYANYILTNDEAFIDLMKIIYLQYENNNDMLIYIVVDFDDIRDVITESLIKFIQQRYGINSSIIKEYEDFDTVEDSEFDINGLYNLDQDKERYVLLVNSNN